MGVRRLWQTNLENRFPWEGEAVCPSSCRWVAPLSEVRKARVRAESGWTELRGAGRAGDPTPLRAPSGSGQEAFGEMPYAVHGLGGSSPWAHDQPSDSGFFQCLNFVQRFG